MTARGSFTHYKDYTDNLPKGKSWKRHENCGQKYGKSLNVWSVDSSSKYPPPAVCGKTSATRHPLYTRWPRPVTGKQQHTTTPTTAVHNAPWWWECKVCINLIYSLSELESFIELFIVVVLTKKKKWNPIQCNVKVIFLQKYNKIE